MDFDKKIQEHYDAIVELKRKRDEFNNRSASERIAVAIHTLACRNDHGYGDDRQYRCGFDSSPGVDWSTDPQQRWLIKAEKLQRDSPLDAKGTLVMLENVIKYGKA